MTPDQYCQDKAAGSGSSFYYSFLLLAPEARRAITALYAFCREVDDVVDECRDEGVARHKLDWWRQEVDRIYAGRPEHPVGLALQAVLPRFDLHREYLLEIIDGMQMDLDQTRYRNFSELSLYCHRVAGVVGLLAAEIFGYRNRATLKYAETLGLAFQLTNILRDVREDAARGRIYLPQDELARFGVNEHDLNQAMANERLQALFQFQAGRARETYRRAHALLPDEDRYAQRSGLIMSAIYEDLLDEIEHDGFRLLEHRLKLTPLRKLWLTWKTYRREKRREKRRLRALAAG